MAKEEFKAKYLREFGRLLEQAYEQRTIQTNVSNETISLTINIPRDKSPEQQELLRTLNLLHDNPIPT